MVTWYDYTTHKAICLPAVGEVALCTLYWGDDEYPDVSVKVAGEWKGDAVVGISELNPNFDFLDARFGSVVRIGIDSLRPMDANSIITQWRPFGVCPFGVRVAFKKHSGAIFFYIGIYGVCTHRMGLLDIPVWCKNPEAAINFINNYSQQKPKPKRWTVEDQKAGRFPEVGCNVDTFTGECVVIGRDSNLKHVAVQYHDDGHMDILHISKIKPIETPEEKSARLREEWCIKALSSASILSGMQEYELKRLGGYIGDIYDALLSGELTMPSKDGE